MSARPLLLPTSIAVALVAALVALVAALVAPPPANFGARITALIVMVPVLFAYSYVAWRDRPERRSMEADR